MAASQQARRHCFDNIVRFCRVVSCVVCSVVGSPSVSRVLRFLARRSCVCRVHAFASLSAFRYVFVSYCGSVCRSVLSFLLLKAGVTARVVRGPLRRVRNGRCREFERRCVLRHTCEADRRSCAPLSTPLRARSVRLCAFVAVPTTAFALRAYLRFCAFCIRFTVMIASIRTRGMIGD